jgi:hypothetical protein
MGGVPFRGPVGDALSRRDFLRGTTLLGVNALVLSALPGVQQLLEQLPAAPTLDAQLADATLQAFADTILPGRPATSTDLGDSIHPKAIAGVDPEAGAVEADVLRLFKSPLVGFDALEPAFLADLETRSLPNGGQFLDLSFADRVGVVLGAFDFGNPARLLYEAAAALPFTAFCGAAVHQTGTAQNCSGYRVMGYPGAAPNGYLGSSSYRRRLSRERTSKGYLS